MRCGPGSASAVVSSVASSSAVVARLAGTPMPLASATKSRFGRDRSSRSAARGPPRGRADALQLHPQDRVGAVGQHDRGDVQVLPRVRPQRGERVHRAAVGLQADHRTVRAGDRRAGGDRQAVADRAAGQREHVVRGRARGRGGQQHTGGVGLVGDDRVLGQQRADHVDPVLRGQLAAGQFGPVRGFQRRLGVLGDQRRPAASSAAVTSSVVSLASTCTWQPSGTRSLGLPG